MQSKLILRLYSILPVCLKNNLTIIGLVMPIAEEQLRVTKQELIRERWQAEILRQKLQMVKPDSK